MSSASRARPIPREASLADNVSHLAAAEGGLHEREARSRDLLNALPAPIYSDITQRRQAEERQSRLVHEVNHRANNLLAVVGAVVRLTKADTVEAFKAGVEGRIGALASAHNLLAKSYWTEADLAALIGGALKADVGGEAPRALIGGEATALAPGMAQPVALTFHELASNAANHGALTSAAGRLRVKWRTPKSRLLIEWTETGGPATRPPARDGVGIKVIRASVAQLNGDVRFDWRAGGLVCEISIPLPVGPESLASPR